MTQGLHDVICFPAFSSQLCSKVCRERLLLDTVHRNLCHGFLQASLRRSDGVNCGHEGHIEVLSPSTLEVAALITRIVSNAVS